MSRPPHSPPTAVGQARDLLALNVIRLRGERGWSQEALAFEAGLHRTFVAHVERRARNISLDNIEHLAQALGVRVDQLLKPLSEA
ncbi:helix-turn-helix domain-containing protein [Aquincola tertiaricarbonis]|uniref:helix-turn-helix domain-containing protein n=1 Tax=Aquincola tertiaricarbonis TaxID=391953 RepID=UPI0035C18FF9